MSRIVVPLDESPLAEEALPWAAYLARTVGGVVHLVGVWTYDEEIWERSGLHRSPSHEEIAAQVEGYLEEVKSRDVLSGIPVTTDVRIGKVSDHVVDVASVDQAGFVVIASQGEGGLKRLVQGSIAEQLVRVLHEPVVVVRPGLASPPIERILLTLDGSETSELALEPARQLARATGAELHLLRVMNPLSELPMGQFGPAGDIARLTEELFASAQEYLERTAQPGERFEVRGGRPLDVIIEFAREKGCDLIVMGTHGRGGVLRLALGSTADAVMRAADRVVMLIPERVRET